MKNKLAHWGRRPGGNHIDHGPGPTRLTVAATAVPHAGSPGTREAPCWPRKGDAGSEGLHRLRPAEHPGFEKSSTSSSTNPYLDEFQQTRTPLVPVATVLSRPYGAYSKKVKVADLAKRDDRHPERSSNADAR